MSTSAVAVRGGPAQPEMPPARRPRAAPLSRLGVERPARRGAVPQQRCHPLARIARRGSACSAQGLERRSSGTPKLAKPPLKARSWTMPAMTRAASWRPRPRRHIQRALGRAQRGGGRQAGHAAEGRRSMTVVVRTRSTLWRSADTAGVGRGLARHRTARGVGQRAPKAPTACRGPRSSAATPPTLDKRRDRGRARRVTQLREKGQRGCRRRAGTACGGLVLEARNGKAAASGESSATSWSRSAARLHLRGAHGPRRLRGRGADWKIKAAPPTRTATRPTSRS